MSILSKGLYFGNQHVRPQVCTAAAVMYWGYNVLSHKAMVQASAIPSKRMQPEQPYHVFMPRHESVSQSAAAAAATRQSQIDASGKHKEKI
jgi:hypothetical protein